MQNKNVLILSYQENEYLLGPESNIHFEDGPGEDSDSGTEVSRGDPDLSLDDGDDSDKELLLEPVTPEIMFIPPTTAMESPFGHSDSSIGTNDSDDLKHHSSNNNLGARNHHQQNQHLELTRSKSTPSSPLACRRDDER